MQSDASHIAVVTGATSFIGRHLVRALLKCGWQIHALIRPSAQPRWTLLDPKLAWHAYDGSMESVEAACAAAKPQVAFHLAAVYWAEHQAGDILPLFHANLLFGTQLAEAMTKHGCLNLVNAGTVWQHYQNRAYDPVNFYAATKQAFEDILEYYVQVKQLRVITLKLYETFGPEDDRPKLLHLLRKAADEGTEVPLTAGEQQMHMVYIDDAVAAFVGAAERLLEGKVRDHDRFAVPAPSTVSVREFVGVVQKVLGQPIAARWGARPYRPREMMVPWAGPSLPGWKCRVSLEEGLKRILTPDS
jgi:nucleoside-diphosphate-sugar epimerase